MICSRRQATRGMRHVTPRVEIGTEVGQICQEQIWTAKGWPEQVEGSTRLSGTILDVRSTARKAAGGKSPPHSLGDASKVKGLLIAEETQTP